MICKARHFKKELLSKMENGQCEDYDLPVALLEELLPRLTAGCNHIWCNRHCGWICRNSSRHQMLCAVLNIFDVSQRISLLTVSRVFLRACAQTNACLFIPSFQLKENWTKMPQRMTQLKESFQNQSQLNERHQSCLLIVRFSRMVLGGLMDCKVILPWPCVVVGVCFKRWMLWKTLFVVRKTTWASDEWRFYDDSLRLHLCSGWIAEANAPWLVIMPLLCKSCWALIWCKFRYLLLETSAVLFSC